MVKLDAKRERFAQEYLADSNGTQAAIRAGYSDKSAHVTSSRLLKHPKVAARIEALRNDLQERQQVSRDSVVDDLYRIAQADLLDYTMDGVLDLNNLPEGASRCIEKIEQIKSSDGKTITRFTLYSKLKAAEQLAKLLGWNEADKVEHKHLHIEMDHNERARRLLGILNRAARQKTIEVQT